MKACKTCKKEAESLWFGECSACWATELLD